MTALPSLQGSVGYIFTSCNLDINSSANVRIKDMVERFKVYDQPRRPEGKEEEWLAGERVDIRGEYARTHNTISPLIQPRDRLPSIWPNIHTNRQARRSLLDALEPYTPGDRRRHLGSSPQSVFQRNFTERRVS